MYGVTIFQGGQRSGRLLATDLQEVTGRSMQIRERFEVQGSGEGGPCRDLHADDLGTSNCYASVY